METNPHPAAVRAAEKIDENNTLLDTALIITREYEPVVEALKDAADFIKALHSATEGNGQIDRDSVMRFGERLKTTAAKLDKRCDKALQQLTAKE